MKICSKCKVAKPLSGFVKDARRAQGVASYCKVCSFALIKAWRSKDPVRYRQVQKKWETANPDRHLKAKFGIGRNDKALILDRQRRQCAGCGATEHGSPKLSTESGWCLDHNHKTGEIRGVLCWPCNVTLGQMKESATRLRLLADYIEQFAGVGTTLKEAVNGFN